jgi:hypothetical protein
VFSYHDDEPYSQAPCYSCREKEDTLKEISYWFRAILDQLYGREKFSLEDLETYLDELAHHLHLNLPKEKLQLAMKPSSLPLPFSQELQSWKDFNQQYLKSLTH